MGGVLDGGKTRHVCARIWRLMLSQYIHMPTDSNAIGHCGSQEDYSLSRTKASGGKDTNLQHRYSSSTAVRKNAIIQTLASWYHPSRDSADVQYSKRFCWSIPQRR